MDVTKSHILIVDDDRSYAFDLKNALKDIEKVDISTSEKSFKKNFAPYKYDLILLDLRLREDKEGLDLLEYIIEEDPSSIVIIISGYGDIATAVEALQKGAKTFLEKDKVPPQEIRLRIEHVLKVNIAERKIKQLEESQGVDEIIGNDPKIKKIRDLVKLVAQDGETTVLIRGETGTGKELVARSIYKHGIRRDGPFLSVALTDMNSETISSELFGHEKGAFTGATTRHYGFFEQAHKGILFIDEIGDIPQDIQLKLLRVLDQKKFRRMKGVEDICVDVQVVTATNRELEKMLKDNSFREDLYYRLKVFEIHLPPLRERKNDIPLLANYMLNQLKRKGRTSAREFHDAAIELMLRYRWPGNVRELRSIVENAALRCKLYGCCEITVKYLESLLIQEMHPSEKNIMDISMRLADLELQLVEEALIRTSEKKTEAWKLLNYSNRFAMQRKVKRLMNKYPDIANKYPVLRRIY